MRPRNSSCNNRSRIVLGPWASGGDSMPGRVSPREIIIARIGCLVHTRHLSEEFGRVARVPYPHHDGPRRRVDSHSSLEKIFAPCRIRGANIIGEIGRIDESLRETNLRKI